MTTTNDLVVDYGSDEFLTSPWPVYARLRDAEPVHWSPQLGSFFLVRYADVRRALTSSDLTVEHPFRASRQVFGPTLLDLDGSVHARLKGLVRPHFKPERSEAYAAEIVEPIVAELIDRIAPVGGADLVSELALQVPIAVLTRLLGLPPTDGPRLLELLRPITAYIDTASASLEEGAAARQQLLEYLEGVMDAGMRERETVVGRLLALHSEQGTPDRREIVQMALLLLAAGTETTGAAIGNLFNALLRHPDWLDRLENDPGLVGPVVRESLRWEPPLHTTLRFATTDLKLAGVAVPKGSPIHLCLASANRDEMRYERAGEFLPGRVDGRGMLTFGFGKHACLGYSLAHCEVETVLRLFVSRISSVRPSGPIPPVRGITFHAPKSLPVEFEERPR